MGENVDEEEEDGEEVAEEAMVPSAVIMVDFKVVSTGNNRIKGDKEEVTKLLLLIWTMKSLLRIFGKFSSKLELLGKQK